MFCFNVTAPTKIYTDGYHLSLHDVLPIFGPVVGDLGEECRRNHEVSTDSCSHDEVDHEGVFTDVHPFPDHLSIAGVHERHGKCHHVVRSEEHTYELQSLMRTSDAVFCLTKKIPTINRLI